MAIAVRQAHTLTPCHWPILNLCSPWPRAGADGADPAVLAQLPLALHRPLAALEQLLPARQAAPVRQDEEDDGGGGRLASSPCGGGMPRGRRVRHWMHVLLNSLYIEFVSNVAVSNT